MKRYQNESAFRHAGMWDAEALCLDTVRIVKKDIHIQCSRRISERALAAEKGFNTP